MNYNKNFYKINTDLKNRKKDRVLEYSNECYELLDALDGLEINNFCDVGFSLGEIVEFLSVQDEDIDVYGVEFNPLALTYSKNHFAFSKVVNLGITTLDKVHQLSKLNMDCLYLGYWINELSKDVKDYLITECLNATSRYLLVNENGTIKILTKEDQNE